MNGRTLFAGVVAVLVASGAGTLLAAPYSIGGSLFALPLLVVGSLLVATLHYLLLGLPLSLLVIRYDQVRWWNAGLAGLLVGGLPLPLLILCANADLDGLALASMAPVFFFLSAAGLAGGIAFRAAYGVDDAGAMA